MFRDHVQRPRSASEVSIRGHHGTRSEKGEKERGEKEKENERVLGEWLRP
jgi:hypothetical protein